MAIMKAAVVGAGLMGTGIGQRFALAGCDVVLYDVAQAQLDRALDTIAQGHFGLKKAVERGKVDAEDAERALERVIATPDLAAAVAEADLVIEVAPEDLGLKLELMADLDRLAPAQAILASNTSGFSIEALAKATDRPENVIGWHWAAPAQVMHLAEIIIHPGTSAETADAVVELANRCGANPEVVKDDPFHWGFVANRVLMAVFREADAIVLDGVATPRQVDRLVKDCFRWPIGPFEMRYGARSAHDSADAGEGLPPSMTAHFLAARYGESQAPA